MSKLNIIKIVSFLCYLSIAVNAYAARGADVVSKKIEFSEDCSQKILNFLKLDNSRQEIVVEVRGRTLIDKSYVTGIIKNKFIIVDGKIAIGSFWNDQAGAIPRAKGPRFNFVTEERDSLDQFSGFWKQAIENILKENNKTKKVKNNYIFASSEICSGNENFVFEIYFRKGFANKYGSVSDKYSIGISAGEIISELQQPKNLD